MVIRKAVAAVQHPPPFIFSLSTHFEFLVNCLEINFIRKSYPKIDLPQSNAISEISKIGPKLPVNWNWNLLFF